mgnify:CR=1 FL=1
MIKAILACDDEWGIGIDLPVAPPAGLSGASALLRIDRGSERRFQKSDASPQFGTATW